MRFLWFTLLLIPSLAFSADPPCTLNSNDEVTDTADCQAAATTYTAFVYNVGLCVSEPSPGNLGSCEFWNPKAGEFIFTETSESELIPTRELAPGSYDWLIIIQSPTFKVQGVANFANPMKGYGTSAGTTCWSRGITYNQSTFSIGSRNDWTTECGSSAPNEIPTNQLTYDTFMNGSFVASATATQPSGKLEDVYLTDTNLSLATSYAAVSRMISVTPLSSTIIVPEIPDNQTFQIEFDRSEGMNLKIDNSDEVRMVRAGTIEVTFSRQ